MKVAADGKIASAEDDNIDNGYSSFKLRTFAANLDFDPTRDAATGTTRHQRHPPLHNS